MWLLKSCGDQLEQNKTKSWKVKSVGSAIERAERFYESRDSFEQPRSYTAVPGGLPNLRAKTCGACHTEIYKEWAISTHRRAWLDDAQFQQELIKSRGADDVSWLCVNCHTPLINQLDRLVVGLEDDDIGKPIYEDNPKFDATLQEDAITCASCHVRDGVVYGPYGDSTHAPHPVAKDEELLTERACTQCHQAERVYEDKILGCFFETGRQWKESTFAQKHMVCQDCHMPKIKRKVAPAFDVPVRMTRRHWFGGSLIPKKPEFAVELEPLKKVFGSGVTISLLGIQEPDEASTCAKFRPCMWLTVRTLNDRAGHHFPTGDPERHADVEVHVLEAKGGAKIASTKARFGTKYVWWPKIKKLSDTRLKAGSSHDLVVEIPARKRLIVEIVGRKWRMNEEAFAHHDLAGKYVRGREFYRARWRVDKSGAVELMALEDDLGKAKNSNH